MTLPVCKCGEQYRLTMNATLTVLQPRRKVTGCGIMGCMKIASNFEHMLRNNQSLEHILIPMDKIPEAPNLYFSHNGSHDAASHS
jgi:hypothetical protein